MGKSVAWQAKKRAAWETKDSFAPLKKAALPERREKYFDYSVVFTSFVSYKDQLGSISGAHSGPEPKHRLAFFVIFVFISA